VIHLLKWNMIMIVMMIFDYQVRTKDKTFESVSHLINYHRDNGLPIISAESALVLRNPVLVKR
jgi:hypothetical protein